MPRITPDWNARAACQASSNNDLRVFFSRMTCAFVDTSAYAKAPIARALFYRVEVRKQSQTTAASALGIASRDASYLLAGLRTDLAEDLALLLQPERSSSWTTDRKKLGGE